jgi:hypothetical protein
VVGWGSWEVVGVVRQGLAERQQVVEGRRLCLLGSW